MKRLLTFAVTAALLCTPALAIDYHANAAMALAVNHACKEKIFQDEEIGMAVVLAAVADDVDVELATMTVAAAAAIMLDEAGNTQIFCIIAREALGR